MEAYVHTVAYYETDKMGIVHHSNDIRWMEEARIHYLDAIGWSYDELEAAGYYSPVVSVECSYRSPSIFKDKIAITVGIENMDGARITFSYDMKNEKTGRPVATARSVHCFLKTGGRFPIRIKDVPGSEAALNQSGPR